MNSTSTQPSAVKVKVENRVLTITILREKQLNSLNQAVIEGIAEALDTHLQNKQSDEQDDIRIVVIEGAGQRAFAAGADIAEMASFSPLEARQFSNIGQMLTKTLESLPQIVIGKVRGYALGGGLELALACDLIIASQSAKFGMPEVNLGLIPGFGGTQRLVKRVGLPVALDMILSGKSRTLNAHEAWNLGLISRVVSDDQLDTEVEEVIKGLLSAGPSAQITAKKLVRKASEMSLDAGLETEGHAFGLCFADIEAEEGIRAFLDKAPSPFG
jgi:enoyl-CoA hydratase